MKTKFIVLATMLVSMLFVTSCSDDDEWEAMKWTTNSEISTGNEVAVPAEGAAYSFKCDNYKWVKLNLCSEDGVEVKITSDEKIEREWGVIECKDNVLGVTFNSNNSGKDRNVNVKVTAGNIFDSFSFKQKTN